VFAFQKQQSRGPRGSAATSPGPFDSGREGGPNESLQSAATGSNGTFRRSCVQSIFDFDQGNRSLNACVRRRQPLRQCANRFPRNVSFVTGAQRRETSFRQSGCRIFIQRLLVFSGYPTRAGECLLSATAKRSLTRPIASIGAGCLLGQILRFVQKGPCGKFGKLGTSYRFWFSATFWASGGSALFVFPQSASHTPVVCPLTNTAEDALLGPGGGRRGFFSSAGLWQKTVRIIPILAVVIAIGPSLAHGSPTCMTGSEARAKFSKAHLYMHGSEHCWNDSATSTVQARSAPCPFIRRDTHHAPQCPRLRTTRTRCSACASAATQTS